jgi:hypothetical protein
MKKLLPFAGFCAAVLGIVALILVLATNSIVLDSSNGQYVSGVAGMFGETDTILGQSVKVYNSTPGAIIGFVCLILALLLAIVASLLPLLKKAVNIAGWLGLAAVVFFVIGGILVCLEVPMFLGAQDNAKNNGYGLGGGWVVAAILEFVAAGVAFLPSLFAFLAKKK